MKVRFLYFLWMFCCMGILPKVEAQNFKTAKEYLSFIKKENEKISKSIWKYRQSIAHSTSPQKVENDRQRLLKSVERAITKIKRAKAIQGEEAYKNNVLEYLNMYLSLLKNDYTKIIDMKAVAEQSYNAMEAYILAQKLADERMQKAKETFTKAQKEFAKRNYIQLIDKESELGQKIKISNEVLTYKNKVYLIFFKSHIRERFLLNDVSTGDLKNMQQHAQALQLAAQEGLQALKNLQQYKEDPSLIEATKTALSFFIEETEHEIPKIVEFFLLTEKFNTIRGDIKEKGIKNRSLKEIQQYNAMVEDVNKAVIDFNKRNQELNQQRTEITQQWNEASAKFLSRHIPKN
jgi:hypothetical protein